MQCVQQPGCFMSLPQIPDGQAGGDRYFLFRRAMRLDVSQRLPPIDCTSE
jgi:hypothetical protein